MQALQTADAHCPRAHSPRRGTVVARHAPPSPPGAALACSVLVLNRLYMAVHVVNVRRAFGLLCRELAEVVHLEEGTFATYSFDSWREMSELRADLKQPHDDWIRAVNFEIQVPRVIRLLRFDRLPKQKLHLNRRNVLARDGHVVPVLRPAFSHALVEHRPRSSQEPRRRDDVGERGLCLLDVQREEGRPQPARSPHETRPNSGPPKTQPLAAAEAEQSKIRKLADLAGQRVLGGGGEGVVDSG